MEHNSRMQILIAAVNQDKKTLPETMNIQCDAVVVNQCGRKGKEVFKWRGHTILWIDSDERGVGKSRNRALHAADHEFLQFADEDIRYHNGYVEKIEKEFDLHPEAELFLCDIERSEDRAGQINTSFHRINWTNYGRYGTWAICARTEVIKKHNIVFSKMFGGGAHYSAGEDSLFLHDCLKCGIKMYSQPIELGVESDRPSTWFHGYNEKYFYDMGVLYHFLYGPMAIPFGARNILKYSSETSPDIAPIHGFRLLCAGVLKGRTYDRRKR